MRQQRRNLITAAGGPGSDFSAGFSGTARLTAANTGARFNPPNNTALAVAFWVYPTQLTAATRYGYVGVVDGTAGGDGWFVMRSEADNKFVLLYSSGAGYSAVAGNTPSVNTWYMIVASYTNQTADKGIEIRVYDTGGVVIDSTNVGTGFVNASATGDLYVGSQSAGNSPANARIDKLGIFFGGLTSGQQDALWNNGAGLRSEQLMGAGLTPNFWYDLDETSGSTTWPAFAGGAPLAATGTVTRQPRAGQ